MDARLETKLGFDKVRTAIQDRCSTDYAAARVENEDFCTSGEEISLPPLKRHRPS